MTLLSVWVKSYALQEILWFSGSMFCKFLVSAVWEYVTEIEV